MALTVLLMGAAVAQGVAPQPTSAQPATTPSTTTQTTTTQTTTTQPTSTQPAVGQSTPTPSTQTTPTQTTPVQTTPVQTTSSQPAAQPAAAAPSLPTDPYAPKLLSVAELSRKAQVIVRATVGMPLTIKEGEQNWRVYPLDVLETLAGDAQSLPKVKYQDKGAVLEKPALWVYADVQESPNVPSGEAVLFLYSARMDSPLVGYAQGAFVVSNSRVQGLPAGTPGAQGQAVQPAPAATANQPAPNQPTANQAVNNPLASTPEKAPVTAQGNPVNTAAINSSQAPAPLTTPAVPPTPPAADSSSPGSTSSASLPPSATPTSAAAAANIVNGDIKPPAPPAPSSTPPAAQPTPLPLSAGQLLLDDFRKLVLGSRTGGQK